MADQEYREGLERAILGVLIWDAGAVVRSSARLKATDFVDPRHQLIFEACLRLQEQGKELDPTVVTLELTRGGQLAAAGGADYLGSLHADPRTLDEHLRQLRAEITRLRIAATLGEVRTMAADRNQPIAEIMAETSRRMSEIEGDELLEELPPISRAVDEILDELEHGSDPGTTTGLLSLDRAIQGGIKKQQMVVLAGSTGSGKTAMATLIALRAAEWAARDNERGHVLFFSYEMSRKELGVRMLLQASPLIKDGYHPPNGFSERDKPTVRASLEAIRGLPLLIEERSGETVAAVRGAVERYIQREGRKPALVVVDHIGLLSAPRVTNRTEAVGQITRGLKNMARLLDVPVLALAQLSREIGKREDHRPQLSDLRESGSIEQDANVVLLIYRESYYWRDVDERSQIEAEGAPVELYVAKNRSGPLTKVMLTWYGPHTTFSELPNPESMASAGAGPVGEGVTVIDDSNQASGAQSPVADPEADFADGPPIDDEDMDALFA
jgi:replicative DNA helicase